MSDKYMNKALGGKESPADWLSDPTPTQGAQSEAARVPRVSDERVQSLARLPIEYEATRLASDLRDARQASRDKDAKIADLERRLAEDKAVYQRALTKAGQDLCEMASWMSRADALQARLTEAEQRATAAERRGFEAGRDAAAEIVDKGWVCTAPGQRQYCGPDIHEVPLKIRALAPAAPQEGETTP